MSLNIKNDETCRLARELAQLTGESMTGAITIALRERLERETRARSVEARLNPSWHFSRLSGTDLVSFFRWTYQI